MAKILITGGSGFIGSNLIDYLLSKKVYNVGNIDCLTYASNSYINTKHKKNPRYRFFKQNITDLAALHKIFKNFQPDAVIHLAAESHVDRSIIGPADFVKTNIGGTYNLLTACMKYLEAFPDKTHFRFLHVSTDEVYGALAPKAPAFKETSPYAPNSPYSASKASADHLVRAWYHTYRLPIIITNCSNNYGPLQFPDKLIPVIIKKAIAGQPIPIYGKGQNIRDWLHVKDHVLALERVLLKGKIGERYNIGGKTEIKNVDLAVKICRMLDKVQPKRKPHEKLIKFVVDRPGHDFRYAIDITKIRKDLAWQPSVSFDLGLAQTIDWYLTNRKFLLQGSKK